jgi:hypothetical protein
VAGVTLATQQPAGGRHPGATTHLDASVAAAERNRDLAAAWIAAQVSRGVIVACDPLMCAALRRHGLPAGGLEVLATGAGDPLGSGVVVSTTVVRSELGTRLVSVYAPTVLARFGSGPNAVAVRVTAPDGAPAYLSSAHADLRARMQGGEQLLRNRNVHLLPAGAADVAAGRVDSRLLMTLAALAHSVPVYVRQFTGVGPGASTGTPMRSMTISGAVVLPHQSSYTGVVLTFLRAQRAPFLATASIAGTGAATVLQIGFTAPSPLGLLRAQVPG